MTGVIDFVSVFNKLYYLKAILGIAIETPEQMELIEPGCNIESLNPVRIGSGSYGTVFKGCITNSCNFPVAIKIVFFPKEYTVHDNELIFLRKIRELIEQGKLISNFLLLAYGSYCYISQTPSIVDLIGINPKLYHDKYLMLITEFLEPIDPNKIKDEELYSFCYQIILIFASLREALPKFVHHDSHIGNFFIRRIPIVAPVLTYRVNGEMHFIPNHGFQVVLGDFGLSEIRDEVIKPLGPFDKMRSSDIYKENLKVIKYIDMINVLITLRNSIGIKRLIRNKSTEQFGRFIDALVGEDISKDIPILQIIILHKQLFYTLIEKTIRESALAKRRIHGIELFDPKRVLKFFEKKRRTVSFGDIKTPSEHFIENLLNSHAAYIDSSKFNSDTVKEYNGSGYNFKVGTKKYRNLISIINKAPKFGTIIVYSANKYLKKDSYIIGEYINYDRIMSTTRSYEKIMSGFQKYISVQTDYTTYNLIPKMTFYKGRDNMSSFYQVLEREKDFGYSKEDKVNYFLIGLNYMLHILSPGRDVSNDSVGLHLNAILSVFEAFGSDETDIPEDLEENVEDIETVYKNAEANSRIRTLLKDAIVKLPMFLFKDLGWITRQEYLTLSSLVLDVFRYMYCPHTIVRCCLFIIEASAPYLAIERFKRIGYPYEREVILTPRTFLITNIEEKKMTNVQGDYHYTGITTAIYLTDKI
jgi:hypothetical protein